MGCEIDPAGRISAKVNGSAWTAEIWGATYGGPQTSLYVQGETRDAEDHQESVLDLHVLGVAGPGVYSLTPGETNVPIGYYCDQRMGGEPDPDGDCGYDQTFSTDEGFTGTVTIESLDTATQRVKGSFAFRAVRDDSLTVTISEGTFDLKYCKL